MNKCPCEITFGPNPHLMTFKCPECGKDYLDISHYGMSEQGKCGACLIRPILKDKEHGDHIHIQVKT